MQSQPSQSQTASPFIDVGLHVGPVAYQSFDPFPTSCGAECTFLGKSRDEIHPAYGKLLHIDYHVYQAMAKPVLTELAQAAIDQFQCAAVRIIHATGPVPLGQASILIQTATPHRPESFTATRYLIDQLKLTLPIWKEIVYENGSAFPDGESPSPTQT
ncbi:molybdenum cofactor biosynthesis protein MoaE [Poriferisphaera sp. WC338]|uniref:molybdenum cofactor biosynthesis protein MoaE n=1 Tax=Poriferisphaera sp. WC338 TaxID=3425129 RepID=UPI003D812FE9